MVVAGYSFLCISGLGAGLPSKNWYRLFLSPVMATISISYWFGFPKPQRPVNTLSSWSSEMLLKGLAAQHPFWAVSMLPHRYVSYST